MTREEPPRGNVADIRLEKIMSRPPVTAAPETSLAEAAQVMLDHGVNSLLVVDADGDLCGIVTDGDFAARRVGVPFSTLRRPQVLGQWLGEDGVERVYREARRRTLGEVMSDNVHSVSSEGTVEDVIRVMLDRDVKHIPVVEDGKPLGLIARHDLLKMLYDAPGEEGRARERQG